MMENEELKVGDVLNGLESISVTGVIHEKSVENAIALIKQQAEQLESARVKIESLKNPSSGKFAYSADIVKACVNFNPTSDEGVELNDYRNEFK